MLNLLSLQQFAEHLDLGVVIRNWVNCNARNTCTNSNGVVGSELGLDHLEISWINSAKIKYKTN